MEKSQPTSGELWPAPGVYATGSNGGGSSKCQRPVLGLVTLGVGIGNGLRRESWCSHQCWSRRTTYGVGDDDHKIWGDNGKCCNQHAPVLETKDTIVGRPVAAGVQDVGATVTKCWRYPRDFFCWNQPQILLPLSSVYIGTNQIFCYHASLLAKLMYQLATTVFDFCWNWPKFCCHVFFC